MAKTTAARKPRSASPAAKRGQAPRRQVRKPSPLLNEVKYICLAALGVLLFLSVYTTGAAGVAGSAIKQFVVGVLGFGAYLLPFAVVGLSVYALFAGERHIKGHIYIRVFLLCWLVISWLHIFNTGELPATPGVLEYLGYLYESGSVKNGGLFGGLLGNLLKGVLSAAGAYIVLSVGIIVSLVLLSGRSFARFLASLIIRVRDYIDGTREEFAYVSDDDEEEPEPAPVPRNVKPDVAERARKPERKTDKKRPALFVMNGKSKNGGKTLLISEELASRKTPHPILMPRAERDTETSPKPRLKPESANRADEDNIIPFDFNSLDASPDEDFPDEEESMARLSTDSLPVSKPLAAKSPTAKSFDEAFEGFLFDDSASDEPPFDEDDSPIQFKGLVDFATAPSKPAESRPSPPAAAPSKTDFGAGSILDSRSALTYEHYEYPDVSLLTQNSAAHTSAGSRTQILENSRILEETLKSFRVEAKVVEVSVGPTVTRYDLSPGPGVKVSAIVNLSNDLALSLAARGIRIEAPIPGKAAVGIEIPNKDPQPVFLREIIEDDTFRKFPSRLAFAVGKDIAGAPVVTDVARMPHLLIAGATGSGKSVCINTLITSLLYKSRPDEVKLLMVDPKVVELSVYNGIPHLLIPVVTDPKKASGALSWAVGEMEKRYSQFAEAGVRELNGYNNWITEHGDDPTLPQIVIIIDELADLMMACKGEVEESICRLAQKARAAGIHLIVATQRPSVDVITGLIKANIPSRLAFAVSSGTDSRTVLDMYGAEKLLGKGDMLFLPMGQSKPIRVQGCFVSDKEVEALVDFLKVQTYEEPTVEMIEKVTAASPMSDEDVDEFFREAVEFLLQKGKASTSMLQRQFRIGYNRASRLMEELETRGIVGPEDGVKPRKILITREEYITNYE